MTKSICLPLVCSLFLLFSACQQSDVTPDAPTASAQVRQAQQWLTAPTKWVVQEATENGMVFFKKGVDQIGVADMSVEWLRFYTDGRFEVKLIEEPAASSLFYKIDEPTSALVVSQTADFRKLLNWRTSVNTIQSNQLQLSIIEGSDDKVVLTLVPQS